MADPNAIAGACYVTIDGNSYQMAGEGKYQLSGDTREPLNGQDGFHGMSSKPVPGMMSWTGRDGSAVSIGALNAMTNGTVVFELVNGKTIVGRNMSRSGEPITVNTEDATFDMQFVGPDVSEQ